MPQPFYTPGQPVTQPVQPQYSGTQFPQRPQTLANQAQAALAPAQSRNPSSARSQMPEPDAVPTRLENLQMPSPEALGIQRIRPVEVDWINVRKRLERLSITSVHLSKLPGGGFRFVCVVPALDRPQKIETEALTEAEAIDQALRQAEDWVSRR